MKKFAVLCFLFVLIAVPKAFGADNIADKNLQSVVNQTGFKILNANEIEHRMIFRVEKLSLDFAKKFLPFFLIQFHQLSL